MCRINWDAVKTKNIHNGKNRAPENKQSDTHVCEEGWRVLGGALTCLKWSRLDTLLPICHRKLHNLYSSPNIIRAIKSKRL